ncbi:MAG: TrbI F-type domain-containing protein [Pseudomonadota bacterium]
MSDLNLPSVVHERIDEGARRVAIGAAALAILLSVASLVMTLRQPQPPVVVSISMKSLVEEHMLATVGGDVTQHEAELRTREFAAALDRAVAQLTGETAVLVLASEAVVGSNVPDFTDDIRLRTRAIAADLAARRGASLETDGAARPFDQELSALHAETAAMAAAVEKHP